MENPNGKRWYKSSGIWSGIGSVAIGIFSILTGNVIGGIAGIAAGAGAIFGRATATQEITVAPEKPITPP